MRSVSRIRARSARLSCWGHWRFLRQIPAHFDFRGKRHRIRRGRKNSCAPWRRARTQSVLPTCERLRYGDGSGSGPGQRNRPCGESGSGHSCCRKAHPNVPNIADIAAAAIQGGADGLCAINTMGPECYESHGHPVLTNGKGGVSGKDILPRALECVREIAAITDKPIIACGASAVPATCVTPSRLALQLLALGLR